MNPDARVGFSTSGGLQPRAIVDCAVLAESLGYESFWVAEGHGGDQFALLSACAMATSRIRLGTSISSVFVRSLPTIAMAAATLDGLSNGRFVLGLGSSHRVQVEPEHGVPYGRPIQRVREAVAVIRQILDHGHVQDYQGETVTIERFELWFDSHGARVPIYLAGLFPKMLSACGELADGVILTRTSLGSCAGIRAQVRDGAERAGRSMADIELTSLLPCAVAERRADALDQIRESTAVYAGFFPRYNRLMSESGFPDAAAAIAEAWSRGDRAAAIRAVPDALIDATSIAGDSAYCRARIDAYRDAGIELPILSPRSSRKEDYEAVLRACAPRG